MTPFSFEWHWNVEYFIFMGFLYLALGIVACGLIYCLAKTWFELGGKEKELPPAIPYRSKYSNY